MDEFKMTRDDIIRMAREAGLPYEYDTGRILYLKQLERFAALVAAAERERIESRPWGAGKEWIDRAVEAEREACAKLCDELDDIRWQECGEYKSGYSEAIRARSQNDGH
jgi:hypothetical protein